MATDGEKAIVRVGLAVIMIDGEVTDDETASLIGNLTEAGVSPDALAEVLEETEGGDMSLLVPRLAEDIAMISQASDEVKQALFAMAVELMVSDGEVDENELNLVSMMAEAWDLNADD